MSLGTISGVALRKLHGIIKSCRLGSLVGEIGNKLHGYMLHHSFQVLGW